MIDTHCHLTYDGLHEQVDDVIQRAAAAGVDRMISVATTPSDAQRIVELAGTYANVFATVGVHPHYAASWTDLEDMAALMKRIAMSDQIVALGEMGLDYHYNDPHPDVQRQVFEAQLQVVSELDELDKQGRTLPIIIHNREATDDTLAVLRSSQLSPERFVFHCFTGNADELDAILNFGAMVSVTGIVTFKNAKALATAIDRVPLDRLMIETDSPFLTPEPHRKVRTNEPQYVADVARFLAARRNLPLDEFTAATDRNAEQFFGL